MCRQHLQAGRVSSIDGVRLFSVAHGAVDEQPPILFLHGIPTWSWLWRNVLPVTAAYTNSIAVDLPGFGLSDELADGSFSVDALARTMLRFLDATIGAGEPVALAVHDFGALVGAEMIRAAPDRFHHLVIMNTSLQPDAWRAIGPLTILSTPWLGQISMWLARPWMLKMAMRPFLAAPDGLGPDQFAGYWYPFERGFGQSLARMYQQNVLTPRHFEMWRDALGEYRGQALILWGGRDPAFPLRDMEDIQALLPGSRQVVFEHASHFLPEERPRACGRLIRAFLDD